MSRNRRPPSGNHRNRMRTRRLMFEPLESRQLLATFEVLNGLDNGAGSLRETVALANSTPGADQIIFRPGVSAVTLTTGQLTLTDTTGQTTINGGLGRVTIARSESASFSFRIFEIARGVADDLGKIHPLQRIANDVLTQRARWQGKAQFLDAGIKIAQASHERRGLDLVF